MKIFNYEVTLSKAKTVETKTESVETVESAKKQKEVIEDIFQQQLTRANYDISQLNNAQQSAESVRFPNRQLLLNIYHTISRDANLSSLMEIRENKVMAKPYQLVDSQGVESPLTSLIETSWFQKIIKLMIQSRYHGYSLIQLSGLTSELKFEKVYAVPHQYVKPELGLIVNTPADQTGYSYLESNYDNLFVIPAYSSPRDLGLLLKVAKLLLFKQNI